MRPFLLSSTFPHDSLSARGTPILSAVSSRTWTRTSKKARHERQVFTFSSYTVLLVSICQRSETGYTFRTHEPMSCSVNGTVVVENNGFEPLTPCLQSRCSSQLS